jgi:spermidine/putrescine transport system ATP-binding protein
MTALSAIREARRSFITPEDGRLAALDGVNLDFGANEFVTLLGSSGCGKTTLLRAISGFEGLDSGTMRLDGADLAAFPPFRRPVNAMFQSYALFGHMTVAHNVGYTLEVASVAKASHEAQVAEVLEQVGLAGVWPHAGRRNCQAGSGKGWR